MDGWCIGFVGITGILDTVTEGNDDDAESKYLNLLVAMKKIFAY